MTLFMMMSALLTSMIFPFLKHPLSMGMILILQTISISVMTGLLMKTFWFSYIILITMLSGALVLFIYMASIASNEKFNSSMTITSSFLCFLITMLPLSILLDQMGDQQIWSSESMITSTNDQVITLIKMFNMHTMFMTIIIVMYLFLTMIIISYIVNIMEGPLRMKN